MIGSLSPAIVCIKVTHPLMKKMVPITAARSSGVPEDSKKPPLPFLLAVSSSDRSLEIVTSHQARSKAKNTPSLKSRCLSCSANNRGRTSHWRHNQEWDQHCRAQHGQIVLHETHDHQVTSSDRLNGPSDGGTAYQTYLSTVSLVCRALKP